MRRLGSLIAVAALTVLALVHAPAYAAGGVNTWSCSTGDSASGCSSSTLSPMTTARASLSLVNAPTATSLYALGGQTASASYTGANQAYSPTGNTWSSKTADGTARAGTGAAISGSTIYVFGGQNSSGYQTTAESYSVSGDSWTALTGMPTARAYLRAAVGPDGLIYAMGGTNGSSYLSTVEAWSPSALKWYCSTTVTGCSTTSTPPVAMPTARSNFAVAVGSNGLIYAIGGQTGASTYTKVVEAYNTTTRTWTCSVGDAASRCSSTTLAAMPTARAASAGVTASGLIYVVGGSNGSNLPLVEVYNPTSNTWACSTGDSGSGCASSVLTPLPTARQNAGVAVGSDGQVYVIGGNNGSYLSTVEAYNPPTTPGTPTGVSAVPGSGTATISWTAPVSTGGMPITGYTVSCSPSCTPVTVGSSSTAVAISGLTNGTSYTFTVVANNFVGSSSGATSSAVTPSTCTAGTPSVSGAGPGSFSTTLNGSNQTIYTTLATYTATDNACGGWNITFQASRLTCTAPSGQCPAGGDSLPAGSLFIGPPTVACSTGTSCLGVTGPPSISISGTTALDGGAAVKVASAASNTGDGSYVFTPANLSGSGTPLCLSVPSSAYATTYTSTVTVSSVSGP